MWELIKRNITASCYIKRKCLDNGKTLKSKIIKFQWGHFKKINTSFIYFYCLGMNLSNPITLEVIWGQFLSRIKLVWIQGFSFPRWIAKPKLKFFLLNYFFIAEGRRDDGFMPFPLANTASVLVLLIYAYVKSKNQHYII